MTFIRNQKIYKYTVVAESSPPAESFRYEFVNESTNCYLKSSKPLLLRYLLVHICSLSIHKYLSGGLRVAVTVSRPY